MDDAGNYLLKDDSALGKKAQKEGNGTHCCQECPNDDSLPLHLCKHTESPTGNSTVFRLHTSSFYKFLSEDNSPSRESLRRLTRSFIIHDWMH